MTINKITNASVYVDGNSFLGKVEEIELPKVKHKMVEHKALGMIGIPEFWAGIEKLEGKIKWNCLYVDVMTKVANPLTAAAIQVRGSMSGYSAAGKVEEIPVVTHLTGIFKDFDPGSFKQHESVTTETNMSIHYIKQVINDEDIFEIDVIENIYKVGGVDVLADYKANIGQGSINRNNIVGNIRRSV